MKILGVTQNKVGLVISLISFILFFRIFLLYFQRELPTKEENPLQNIRLCNRDPLNHLFSTIHVPSEHSQMHIWQFQSSLNNNNIELNIILYLNII